MVFAESIGVSTKVSKSYVIACLLDGCAAGLDLAKLTMTRVLQSISLDVVFKFHHSSR